MYWFAFLCWSVSSHHHLERGSDRVIGNVEIECHDPTIVLIENNIHNLRHIPMSGKHLAREKIGQRGKQVWVGSVLRLDDKGDS